MGNIEEKIIELLIVSGNISRAKVDQARKLAESLNWEGHVEKLPCGHDKNCLRLSARNTYGCAECDATRKE